MKSLQKTLAGIMIGVILFCNVNISFASIKIASNNIKYIEVVKAEKKLEGFKKGQKYIQAIDKYLDLYKNNAGKLMKIKTRMEKAKSNLGTTKNEEIIAIIEYTYIKTSYILQTLSKEVSQNIKIPEVPEPISQKEQDRIQEKVVQLQIQLADKGSNMIENMIRELETISSYEDKGNMTTRFHANNPNIGNIKFSAFINDYIAQSNLTSGRIQGKGGFEYSGNNQNIKGDTEFDYIEKSGNSYLLLKNLNIPEGYSEDFKSFVEATKKIALSNKYVNLSNIESQELLEFVNTFNLQKMLNDGKEMMKKPMLDVYKKTGNRYYLKPSKYACNTFKKLSDVFDPINGDTCSQKQYENMVEDMQDLGSIYIELGTNTKIGFEGIKNENIDDINGFVLFSNTDIKDFVLNATANQLRYPNEKVTINYKKNDNLDINIYADSGNMEFVWNSKLDSKNNFSRIESKGKFIDTYMNITGSLIGENKVLEGSMDIQLKEQKYDFTTGETQNIDTSEFQIRGTGKQNSTGEIVNINIFAEGKDSKTQEVFSTTKVTYSSGIFALNYDSSHPGSITKLNLSGTWDNNNDVLKKGNFNYTLKQKTPQIDYNTYEIQYTGDYAEVISSNLKLENKILSGKTSFTLPEFNMNIIHEGKIDKDLFDWKNNFSLESEVLEYLIPNTKKITGEFNLFFNTQGSKQNASTYFSIQNTLEKICEFSFDYKGNRTLKKIEINAPSKINTINLEEISID